MGLENCVKSLHFVIKNSLNHCFVIGNKVIKSQNVQLIKKKSKKQWCGKTFCIAK